MNAKSAVVVGTAATRCFVADVFQQVPLYWSSVKLLMPKIHYTRFPVKTGKLPTCCGLAADLLATRPTSPQQVGNKSL